MHFGFTLDLSDIDFLNVDLLDQSYTHLYLFVSETSWRRRQDMSSRRLQDMSSRRLQDMSSRRLQDVLRDVFKTFSRRLGRRKIVTLKTCWRRLQDMPWRGLQDILKTSKCLLGYYSVFIDPFWNVLFYKKVIVLHHGDDNFIFWHLYQIHTFSNNLNDEEMITSRLMCIITSSW